MIGIDIINAENSETVAIIDQLSKITDDVVDGIESSNAVLWDVFASERQSHVFWIYFVHTNTKSNYSTQIVDVHQFEPG